MDEKEKTNNVQPDVNPQPEAPPALPGPPAGEIPFEEGSERFPTLELDFTDVTTEFEPLPVGQYPAVVSNVEHIPQSKSSGRPFLKFTFTVTGPEEYVGRKLFDNYSLTKDSRWKLAKTLEALGYEVVGKRVGLNVSALLGLPCQLVVSQGVYQGKLKNEVQDVLEVDAGEAEAGDPAPF